MSAPVILSVIPTTNAVDVILGTLIIMTFDQVINTATLNSQTFSLTGPGKASLVDGASMLLDKPTLEREYIIGKFTFSTNSNNQTVAIFTPDKPLQPNTTYAVMIVGAGSPLISSYVANGAGESMASTYQYTFNTGSLNLKVPPPQAPLPMQMPRINVEDVIVRPKSTIDNDLTRQIEIIFPSDIDVNSFDPTEIEVGIEPILGDLNVRVPRGLQSAITVEGNTITVVVSGWPAPPPEWQ